MSIDSVRAIGSNTPYAVALSDDLGHTWTGDEPESLGGGNTGPSPSRLILSGLASCTVVTVQMYAARKQWPLRGIEVEVQWNPNGKPEDGSTEMRRRVTLRGDLSAEQRERLLQIANAYPMHKALTGIIRVPTEIQD